MEAIRFILMRRISEENKEELAMKKLFMAAAALTIAVATTSAFVGQSEAASAKSKSSVAAADSGPNSEFCKMAKSQRNVPSWNEHYKCLKTPQRQALAQAPAPARAPAVTPERGPGSQYCNMAKFQRNAPWIMTGLMLIVPASSHCNLARLAFLIVQSFASTGP
jgi:hypothetical protein